MSEKQPLRFKTETVEGDIHTPVSIFKKLPGKKKFLLESSATHHDSGRFSYIGTNPYLELAARGNQLEVSAGSSSKTFETANIIERLKKELFLEMEKIELEIPFYGGAIGYLGYDMIRQYEEIGPIYEDVLQMPDAHLLLFQDVYVFDHIKQKIHIITSGTNPDSRLEEMKKILDKPYHLEASLELEELSFTSNMTKEKFEELVRQAKEAIVAGEVFQMVLSQRFQSPFSGDPFQAYRKLRLSNPSPYMFFIDFEDYTVLGSSPESLISVKDHLVNINPIAGTRPRGSSPEEDQAFEQSLLNDEKELAEHRMLLDLGRNDVGRVCEIGSISISAHMKIERYKHVMHIASKIKGQLKQEHTSLDALTACMPAGTVSGAPKIRAMEWINKLEQCKRGVYAGSIGYIGFGGNLDMALAIRTMVIKDGSAYVQAGAGIVYDSVPETEYEETRNKAKALLEVQKNDSFNR